MRPKSLVIDGTPVDIPDTGSTPAVRDSDVDPDVLAAHLRRLDGESLVDLVEALWTARGYAVDREDGVLVATRDERRVVLHCGVGGRADTDGPVDVVVAPGAGRHPDGMASREGASALDAEALADMLLYGVDRPTGRRLCERHLGAPPESLALPGRDRARRQVDALRRRTPPPAVLAVALALAVLAVGVGGQAAPDLGEAVVAVGSALGDGSRQGASPAGDPGTDGDVAGAYPPGVGPGGVEDVEALAAAHRRTFAGASYSVWIDLYRPSRSTQRQRRVRHDVDASVDGRRYLVDWAVDTPRTTEPVLTVYRDGSGRYVADATGNDTTYRRADRRPTTPVAEPFALRRVLVTRYLATPETTIVTSFTESGRTQYRIDGTGAPDVAAMARVSEYEVIAVVDERGFVRKLTVEYTVLADAGSYDVSLRVRYGRIGTTSVDRPSWVDRIDERSPTNGTAEDRRGPRWD